MNIIGQIIGYMLIYSGIDIVKMITDTASWKYYAGKTLIGIGIATLFYIFRNRED